MAFINKLHIVIGGKSNKTLQMARCNPPLYKNDHVYSTSWSVVFYGVMVGELN